jgi:ribosome biogenesis GTPase A
VTESSQVLLILADARCPPIHLPTSLRSYVNALKPRKEVIIVLTKSDLVDPSALAGWREWVRNMWTEGDAEGHAAVQVVAVKSYDTELLQGE